jgi:2-methylcitrate dehydratase PrpD
LKLLESHDIPPEDIDEIVVDVTPTARDFAVGQPFKIRDVPQIDAAFNLQYNVANAILRKSSRLEHYTEEYIRDPGIMEIVPKIRLTTTTPPDKPLGAGVKIKMKEGVEFETRVDMPKGNGTFTPLTAREKRAKFFDNVRFSHTISLDKAEKALGLLERLEEVDNVAKVVALLVA